MSTLADQCWSAIKACCIRVVRLDSCGRPVTGPNSVGLSKGFITVTASADIEEGEEFLQKNACGELCINEKDCDILKRYNLTVNFCKVDPGLVELMSGNRAITDPVTGDFTGWASGSNVQCEDGFSLELWQKIAGSNCGTDGIQQWAYHAWPWVTGGVVGDLTFENGPFTFDMTAHTKAVGDGTWNPQPLVAAENDRGPFQVLAPGQGLLAGEHYLTTLTKVQPPCDGTECGLVAFP